MSAIGSCTFHSRVTLQMCEFCGDSTTTPGYLALMRDAAGNDEKTQGPFYPEARTFILRFDRTADLCAGRWTGKLEEVESNGRHRFTDLVQLLQHLHKLVG